MQLTHLAILQFRCMLKHAVAFFILGILFFHTAKAQELLINYNETVEKIENRQIDFTGICEITITGAENPLAGSTINLKSNEIWIYFPNLRPSEVVASVLHHILVHGENAVVDQNIRVVQYLQGTMVINHNESYKALKVFSEYNHQGDSLELGNYTYFKENKLGAFHDNISSFVLKKGYMATLAANENGTGISRNFVAADAEIRIDSLPEGLAGQVSFIRVFPWRWTTKKGWSRTSTKAELLQCGWQYDWNNEAESSLDVEYIPMRHNKWWNGYQNIQSKQNTTAALHFNEPNNPVDDGYATVQEALDQWPQMLASGLRVGTPAPTDGGVAWLKEFYDSCVQRNYRIDFVAIHFYRGGQNASQFYNFLKDIHDYTGLPIWITEWNNGANWTCCLPTYESQANTLDSWLNMLEAAPFVERYAIYENVEATRQLFFSGTDNFTLAGEVYRDKVSALAYGEPLAQFEEQPSGGVRWASFNFPERNIRHLNNTARIDPDVAPVDDQQWKMIPGLADSDGVTFESVNEPGKYLRHDDDQLILGNITTSAHASDATFYQRSGLADSTWFSFEAANKPGYYIRHYNYVLRIDQLDTELAKQDATFKSSTVQVIPNSTFKLVARHSQKALTGKGSSDQFQISQADYHGSSYQRWELESTKGGYFKIINLGNGLALSTSSTSNESICELQEYTASDYQQWRLIDAGNQYFNLINRASGRVLTVENENELAINQDKQNSENQHFTFVDVSEEAILFRKAAQQDLMIYPNPVKSLLTIDPGEQFSEVYIYKLDGTLRVFLHDPVSHSINVADLESGIYLLVLKNKDVTKTAKFFKE